MSKFAESLRPVATAVASGLGRWTEYAVRGLTTTLVNRLPPEERVALLQSQRITSAPSSMQQASQPGVVTSASLRDGPAGVLALTCILPHGINMNCIVPTACDWLDTLRDEHSSQLRKQLEEERVQQSEMRAQIEQMRKKAESATADVGSLEKELAEGKASVGSLERQLGTLREQLSEARAAESETQKQASAAAALSAEEATRIADLQADRGSFHKHLGACRW